MPKILSVSVQAHESRAGWFDYLKEKLGQDVPFAIDKGKRGDPENLGVWGNCRRAWLMYDPTALYHVVIQDDAIVCENFRELAEEFILKHAVAGDPLRAFNFYFGNKKALVPQAHRDLSQGFTIKDYPSWGVAICLPVAHIDEMVTYCDQFTGTPQDDVRIGRFIKSKAMPIYYPLPSLIDHRTGELSLVGDPGENRRAIYFIDRPNA